MFRAVFLVLAGLLLAGSPAAAQTYPEKQITLLIPYAAGGPTDIVGRLIREELARSWNVPVIVDNRPGAGGNLGTGIAARAAADGYTLLLTVGSPFVQNPYLYPSLPFDPVKDFLPVTLLTTSPLILAVRPDLPVQNVAEFIALAKKGGLKYATGGNGTNPHLAAEMLKQMAGVDILNITYRGAAAGTMAVLSGEVDAFFDVPSVLTHVAAGKAKALAQTTARRSVVAPNLPTMQESGLPDFAVASWIALFVQRATPAPIVDKLQAEFVRIISQPAMKAKLLELGYEAVGSSRAQMAAYFEEERVRWEKIVKASGAKAD